MLIRTYARAVRTLRKYKEFNSDPWFNWLEVLTARAYVLMLMVILLVNTIYAYWEQLLSHQSRLRQHFCQHTIWQSLRNPRDNLLTPCTIIRKKSKVNLQKTIDLTFSSIVYRIEYSDVASRGQGGATATPDRINRWPSRKFRITSYVL